MRLTRPVTSVRQRDRPQHKMGSSCTSFSEQVDSADFTNLLPVRSQAFHLPTTNCGPLARAPQRHRHYRNTD